MVHYYALPLFGWVALEWVTRSTASSKQLISSTSWRQFQVRRVNYLEHADSHRTHGLVLHRQPDPGPLGEAQVPVVQILHVRPCRFVGGAKDSDGGKIYDKGREGIRTLFTWPAVRMAFNIPHKWVPKRWCKKTNTKRGNQPIGSGSMCRAKTNVGKKNTFLKSQRTRYPNNSISNIYMW